MFYDISIKYDFIPHHLSLKYQHDYEYIDLMVYIYILRRKYYFTNNSAFQITTTRIKNIIIEVV